MLHGLIERPDGTAESRFGLARLIGYVWVHYRAEGGATDNWPFRRLDQGFDHLCSALLDLARKLELAARQYAAASDDYLASLDSDQGLRGYEEMSVALDIIIVYLRLLPDLVADVAPYFYGHPQPSVSSFRAHRKWFVEKRPSVDPKYAEILQSHTSWFERLARRNEDDDEKGLRDLLIHRFGWFQFPVVVGAKWSNERVTADLVTKSGYHEGVEEILPKLTRDLFRYLDLFTGHLNARVSDAAGWAPLSHLDGTGCKLMDYTSLPPSSWLFPTAAL